MTVIIPGRPQRPIVVEGEVAPTVTVQPGRDLPPGGTAGQALIKSSDSDFATTWGTASASAAWGGITGTLSSQTDLVTDQNARDTNNRARANHTGTQAAATITGLATVATSGSAADLGTGTLPAARLPAFGSGDVSFAASGGAGTIAAGAVTLAKQANMATASVVYRKTAGSGAPEVQTLATLKTDLGLTGTNSGDQTITLTSDVTGSGAGSFATTLATVNANVGAFGSATQVATFTVNAKGLTTAAANVAISIPMTAISDSTAAGRAVLGAATATAQTALFDLFTSAAKGLAPASGGGTTNFLRADGTWAAPGGGGSLTVQDEGVTLSTAVTTINFTGAGVTATGTTTVTVNVPGGGASATPWGHIMAARQGLARL